MLLPELEDQVRVIVGTSAGALIASYIIDNWHRPAKEAIEDGLSLWRDLTFGDVCAPLMAVGGATRFMRYVGEFLPVSSMHGASICAPNRCGGRFQGWWTSTGWAEHSRAAGSAGVVAVPAYGNRLVVFHRGGSPRHREDALRGIEYVATPELGPEHILASSAIPGLFPAERVTTPEPAAGWYYDGGSRLNTPIKPALWMGAERVIVIALNSVAPSRTANPDERPDFYVGAAHLLHAALGDPLAQDIRTLANTNALIGAGLPATNGRARDHRGAARQQQPGGLHEPVQPVPYIFIAPEDPAAIGEIARRVYRKHYGRPWKAGARDLWLLGKILDAGADALHAELLSYLFFAGEFAEELIRLGQADAQRWLDEHPADLWQLDPLASLEPSPQRPQRRRRRAQPPAPSASPSAPSRGGAEHCGTRGEQRGGRVTEHAVHGR